MELHPDVKAIEALVKMLRRHGVTEFEGNGLKMRIDAAEPKAKNGTASSDVQSEQEMSEQDLLLWSSGAVDGN